MNKLYILTLVFLSCSTLTAQKKTIRRLTYDRIGLMFESGSRQGIDPNTKLTKKTTLGYSPGLQINVNPSYLGQDDDQPFLLGWSLNLDMGYNITEKHVAPYRFDMGFWGGYLITDDLEIGGQYCFLGIYGFQELAHFGASISPSIRYKRFQLTAYRSGAGAVRGCFFPKDPSNNYPQHSLEFMYNLGNAFLIGAKYTKYHPMNKESNVSEWRIFIASTPLQNTFSRR